LIKAICGQWRVYMLCIWCRRPTGGGSVVSAGPTLRTETF